MAAMPSDRRFHPLTVVFALGGELRNFLLPAVFATMTASQGNQAERFFLVFLVPGVVLSLTRYFFSTYRYDATELVVRTGIIFKNERHIPFARIQSVDAVQNVFHRLCGVVDVKVQTGTTGHAEATLSVLPLAALDEMRRHVFEGRSPLTAATDDQGEPAADLAPAAPQTLLTLSASDCALAGLLDNRGWVVIGAAWGLAFESGVVNRLEWLESAGWTAVASVAVGLFVIAPVLSIAWSMVRLHGFHLTLQDDDLRTEYGAFTRVSATIPLRRVQAVEIHQGPGHIWTHRASVRVETAGGSAGGRGSSEREWVAPILALSNVSAFVKTMVPDADLGSLPWQSVDPRGYRRRRVVALVLAVVLGGMASPWLGLASSLGVTALLAVLGLINAQLSVRALGWAQTDRVIAFRRGWFRRTVIVVPLSKIQAVELDETPFDRRHNMASLAVDTAGGGSNGIDIPYLSRPVADAARVVLAREAAATVFRW